MQQAATLAQQAPSDVADGNVASGALRNAFVINLISSTTPVALKPPEHAGLRRFTFFVSRRREEGRERFRLHMGYFDTQEEAEKLLDIVREIYPGAWAGLTPGRGLRGTPAVAQPASAVAASASPLQPSIRNEVLRPIAVVAPALAAAPAKRAAAAPAAPSQAINAERRTTRAAGDRQATTHALGTVRAAIDELEDSAGAAASAALLPKPPQVVPTLRAAPYAPAPIQLVATPKTPARSAVPAEAPTVRAPQRVPAAPQAAPPMNERAVLAMLESPAAAGGKTAAVGRADERPCYAVQLAWSGAPIDLARVPQLAIFNAYTLYGAQGHRDGQRWYGLRLGFFTDAVSAKQVAQYVRADFATVSVVPVSPRERDQAKRAIGAASAPSAATVVPVAGAARPVRATPVVAVSLAEFKFIDDAAAAPQNSTEVGTDIRPQRGVRPSRGAPGKRAVFRAGRIHGRSKAKQMTLEQTLEILGANDLEVEPRKKRIVSEGGAPTPAAPSQGKPSRLSRLFERLSERLGT